ncbi:hypothetical protein V4U86_28670 [Mycobacterium sp. AMU20-3851]
MDETKPGVLVIGEGMLQRERLEPAVEDHFRVKTVTVDSVRPRIWSVRRGIHHEIPGGAETAANGVGCVLGMELATDGQADQTGFLADFSQDRIWEAFVRSDATSGNLESGIGVG